MNDRLAWLQARQQGIGSSDAASLFGVGYRTAADVYRSKVEPAADTEPTGVLARGLALEQTVADLYSRQTGVGLTPGAVAARPGRPWMLATTDRHRPDGNPVELKTTAGFGERWGEPGTDEVPAGYLCQVQHQLAVTEADFADLAALDVIAWELRVYRVPADPAFIAWLTEQEGRFWHDHVLPRVPPGPEWERQFDDSIPLPAVKGKAVELGADALALIDRRKKVGQVRDEADAEYRRLTARLTAMLGDAEVGTCGGYRLKRVEVGERVVSSYTAKAYSRLDIRAVKGKAVANA